MKLAAALLSAGAITVGLVALAPAVTATAAPTAGGSVFISGIWYNSPGPDRGSNASLNHEWVQLHNTTGHAITLSGWTLRDKDGHVFTFGTYRLGAHGYVKIHTGRGQRTQANRYWNRTWYIWNNTGDTATLETGLRVVRSICKYSAPHQRREYTRCRGSAIASPSPTPSPTPSPSPTSPSTPTPPPASAG